jgi:hypothetical protein
MTGHSFAPVGFDFTFSALSFHYQHWSGAFLLVLSVDDTRARSLSCPATAAFTERIRSSNLKRGKGRACARRRAGGDRTPASRIWRRPEKRHYLPQHSSAVVIRGRTPPCSICTVEQRSCADSNPITARMDRVQPATRRPHHGSRMDDTHVHGDVLALGAPYGRALRHRRLLDLGEASEITLRACPASMVTASTFLLGPWRRLSRPSVRQVSIMPLPPRDPAVDDAAPTASVLTA